MKEKFLSFSLAVLLAGCLAGYLFYHVGLISWMGQASPFQWMVLVSMTLCSGLLIAQGYGFVIRILPWDKGHLVRSLALLIILTSVLTTYALILNWLVQGWLVGSEVIALPLSGSYSLKAALISLIISLLIIWIDYSWFAFARYSKETIHRLKSARNKKELQFNLLRSQLTPHFLFNSLNTASHLVSIHPDQAEDFIRKLAFNFTNLLRNGTQPLNSLGRELEIIDNYMHLMKVRYGEKVILEKRINVDTESNFLPALGIQLLVENALKHNVASLESPLKIIITADQGKVVVTNSLTYPPENIQTSGIGLKNLRERYLHQGKSVPSITQSGGFYEVRLPYVAKPENA